MSNITKPTIRVITSTYSDEYKMKWTTELVKQEIPYIIYSKNNNMQLKTDQYNRILPYQRIEIPNYGRCEYVFFHHIVTNYDDLDDVTIFTKCNWQEYDIPFWDLLKNCKTYDYMTVGTHPEVLDYTEKQGTNEYNHIDRQYHGNLMLYRKLYDHIFGENVPKPRAVRIWGHGPCFSVSKSLIQRYPKSVYEYLLRMMEFTGNNRDMMNEISVINHNQLQRFYTVLFTHNISDSEYTIYPNDVIPNTNVTKQSRKTPNRFMNMLFA
jgi:Protein of unknown function (DUF3431)